MSYGAIGRESLIQPGVSSAEHAEVLSAMLRLAEGEIRAKDEQISLLHKMVGANEDEIGKKEGQIAQLNDQLAKLQGPIHQIPSQGGGCAEYERLHPDPRQHL